MIHLASNPWLKFWMMGNKTSLDLSNYQLQKKWTPRWLPAIWRQSNLIFTCKMKLTTLKSRQEKFPFLKYGPNHRKYSFLSGWSLRFTLKNFTMTPYLKARFLKSGLKWGRTRKLERNRKSKTHRWRKPRSSSNNAEKDKKRLTVAVLSKKLRRKSWRLSKLNGMLRSQSLASQRR